MSENKILPPNYTQCPNVIIDYWLPLLGYAEIKILMVIIRKTIGWHKQLDTISLQELENLTGLSRQGVINGTSSLLEKELITKEICGEPGEIYTYYGLNIKEIPNGSSNLTTPQSSNLTTPPCHIHYIKEREHQTKDDVDEKPHHPQPSFTKAEFDDLLLNLSNLGLTEIHYYDVALFKACKQYSLKEVKKVLRNFINMKDKSQISNPMGLIIKQLEERASYLKEIESL